MRLFHRVSFFFELPRATGRTASCAVVATFALERRMAGATRAAAAAASGKAIKALVLDFDSTISTPTFLERANQWAVADNVPLFESMSAEERVANFGGKARIEQLASCLKDLKVRPSRSDRQDSLQRTPKPLGLVHLNAIPHPPNVSRAYNGMGPRPLFTTHSARQAASVELFIVAHPCRKQGCPDSGQLAHRRPLSAPEHASGHPELRPVSAHRPVGGAPCRTCCRHSSPSATRPRSIFR